MLRRFQDYIDDAYTPLERADRVAEVARTIVDITSRCVDERFGRLEGARGRRSRGEATAPAPPAGATTPVRDAP